MSSGRAGGRCEYALVMSLAVDISWCICACFDCSAPYGICALRLGKMIQ